jgi:hypothetical protein
MAELGEDETERCACVALPFAHTPPVGTVPGDCP